MQKVIKSLREHRLPRKVTRAQWSAATVTAFTPYFRRKQQLQTSIDSFHVELRNLARIARYPEYLDLLAWCLRLHRRVLRGDRRRTYDAMLMLFGNMQASADRWMSMFETASPLDPSAAVQDHVYQLFTTIEGVAEGCFKPQLQIMCSFAQRDANGAWPDLTEVDFGRLVGDFPNNLRASAQLLFADPEFGVSVNQWRNIAAHKAFNLVGPMTIEVRYGRKNVQTLRLGVHRLRRVWHWLLRIHTAVRLANTITYVEHMPELHAIGIPMPAMRMSATVLQVAHSLSTVGFESIAWDCRGCDGVLLLKDRMNRQLRKALIHASQMLVELAVGVLCDPATRNRLKRVGMTLVRPDGSRFGTALVSVQIADEYSRRQLSMKEYVGLIEWVLESTANGA